MSEDYTQEAYNFFYEHGGFSYRPMQGETREMGKVNCAQEKARAEQWIKNIDDDYKFIWEDDPDGTVDGKHPAYICTLWVMYADQTDGEHPYLLASLGGIDAEENDPYRRVVEAEIALEANACHPLDRNINA